jgi:hypothetical protein
LIFVAKQFVGCGFHQLEDVLDELVLDVLLLEEEEEDDDEFAS